MNSTDNSTTVLTVGEREESSMAAVWTVHLCVCIGDSAKYRVFNGRHEALANREEFFNEDTEEYEIPDEIGGLKVFGLEDEWIVGGHPSWTSEQDTIEFDDPESRVLTTWLTASGWTDPLTIQALKKLLSEL